MGWSDILTYDLHWDLHILLWTRRTNAVIKLRWFIGDFTLTPQYFESSLSVNCHDGRFHRLPTISLNRVCKLILYMHQIYWGGSRGGGSRGPRTPPGPQRGGPGPLFQNEENSIYYLQFYLIPPNKSL